jgi:hypothetical protein
MHHKVERAAFKFEVPVPGNDGSTYKRLTCIGTATNGRVESMGLRARSRELVIENVVGGTTFSVAVPLENVAWYSPPMPERTPGPKVKPTDVGNDE